MTRMSADKILKFNLKCLKFIKKNMKMKLPIQHGTEEIGMPKRFQIFNGAGL
jgi:hypothetical protein